MRKIFPIFIFLLMLLMLNNYSHAQGTTAITLTPEQQNALLQKGAQNLQGRIDSESLLKSQVDSLTQQHEQLQQGNNRLDDKLDYYISCIESNGGCGCIGDYGRRSVISNLATRQPPRVHEFNPQQNSSFDLLRSIREYTAFKNLGLNIDLTSYYQNSIQTLRQQNSALTRRNRHLECKVGCYESKCESIDAIYSCLFQCFGKSLLDEDFQTQRRSLEGK